MQLLSFVSCTVVLILYDMHDTDTKRSLDWVRNFWVVFQISLFVQKIPDITVWRKSVLFVLTNQLTKSQQSTITS